MHATSAHTDVPGLSHPSTAAAGSSRCAPRIERRLRRSDDAVTALHFLLSTTCTQARLQAVVLVDSGGCLVAGAGAWPVCEELAAYAPLLRCPTEVVSHEVGGRVAALSREASLVSFSVDGTPALLCGRGTARDDGARDLEPAPALAWLEQAAQGCRRILGAQTSVDVD